MKYILQIWILLFVFKETSANNYYFSTTGNDITGNGTISLPYQTITKLNAIFSTLNAGDSVLFKKGDTFYGKIVASKSGTVGSPIVIGAYGVGINPIISGFTNVTAWKDNGGGIWSSNIPTAKNSLIVVTINGKLQQIGRYPNSGYLTYTAINPATPSITGSALSTTTNWTGSEVVIRKQHWILDRCRVTAHVGGVVSYINPVTPNTYFGKVGYGYFFQDDIRTLDIQGEWFLNKSTKDLSVYFGVNNPASYSIKVSTIDTLLNLGGLNGLPASNNITIENIYFEGANNVALAASQTNLKINKCTFNNNSNATYLYQNTGTTITNNVFTNTLNTGIAIISSASSNSTITNNTVRNCGMIAGMGKSGDDNYKGLQQAGNNATIEYNRIDSIGYNALQFQSSSISVRYNYVTNFCMVLDDGGGIYTWSGNATGTGFTNRIIQNNIVINAQGAPAGTEGTASAHCIYLDGHAMNVNVLNNTLSQASASGLFLNDGDTIRATGNTIFNVPISYNLNRMNYTEPLLRNNTFTNNICYPNTNNIFYWNGALNQPVVTDIQSDMRAMFATIDSNQYRNDISAPFYWFYHLTQGGTFVNGTPVNLDGWKKFIGSEASSVAIAAGGKFYINPSSFPIVVQGVIIPAWSSKLIYLTSSSIIIGIF